MIGDIFRSATRVLVWLGPHANDSAQLFRQQKQGELLSDLYIPTAQGDTIARAWCYFFSRQYWSRTWIVQEIVLARSILLHCGNSELKWEDITKLLTGSKTSELLKHFLKWSDPLTSSDLHAGANRIRALVEHRSREQNLHNLFPDSLYLIGIFDLVIACKETKCSDKRDKVYALLSLCRVETEVEPDYKINIEELFVKLFAQETRLAYYDFNQVAVSMDLYSLDGCHKIVSSLLHGDGLPSNLTLQLISWIPKSAHRLLCTEVYGAAGLDRFHPREIEVSAMSSDKDRLRAEVLKLKQEIELRIPEQERKESKARSKAKQKSSRG